MPEKIENAQKTTHLNGQRGVKHISVSYILETDMDRPTLRVNSFPQEKSTRQSEPIGQTATLRCCDIFHSTSLNAHLLQYSYLRG
jgi:hypothetical protein